MAYDPYTVGLEGERAVVEVLKREGWEIVRWDTKTPGSTDIEAIYGKKKILVQVKASVYPNQPDGLSKEEEANLTIKAILSGAEAWEVKVVLDKELNPIKIDRRILIR